MNISMWRKALNIIPRVTMEEWQGLDVISKWLISSRAVVLIMTFISASIAGILAIQAGSFHFGLWLLLAIGLLMAHGTNNLLNDYTDFSKGVDQDNYFRSQYGPQTLVHGLMTKRQLLAYAAGSGIIAIIAGLILVYLQSGYAWLLFGLGIFFVLFYTWPLKYFALGEIAVLIVWGPLMIGGGYYIITGEWDWNVIFASLPYALGVTGVIFGKHIDKYGMDKSLRIHTLPVVIGEKAARAILLGLIFLQYILVVYLIIIGFFTPVLLIVFLAVKVLLEILPMFRNPRPAEKPDDYPQNVWPGYFAAAAFFHNRRFGLLFLAGLILDTVIKLLIR
jgi:1,4-dihydroxy-2-naphthoate octaprenyltransferase